MLSNTLNNSVSGMVTDYHRGLVKSDQNYYNKYRTNIIGTEQENMEFIAMMHCKGAPLPVARAVYHAMYDSTLRCNYDRALFYIAATYPLLSAERGYDPSLAPSVAVGILKNLPEYKTINGADSPFFLQRMNKFSSVVADVPEFILGFGV